MSTADLESLTQSLLATASSLPSTSDFVDSRRRQQQNGISLFELKNDLFLSYLHHLSFLILCRLRGVQLSDNEQLGAETVKKLGELRVWMEKGVRPCEGRLKYQIEKVLKAAADWERGEERKRKAAVTQKEDEDDTDDTDEESGSDSDSGSGEDEKEDDDSEITSESDGSDNDDKEEEDEEVEGFESGLATTTSYDSDDLSASINKKSKKPTSILSSTDPSNLSYRPNPTSLMKDLTATATAASSTSKTSASAANDGIYRPPKITPVAMAPLPSQDDPDRRTRGANGREGARKSFAVDEYVESELSSAPLALPSIGSTISDLGRKTTTSRERAKEAERTAYEESNFVRLPKQSKKEMRAEKKRQGGRSGGWGGEDWRGIEGGMGLDRIERLTKRKKGDDSMKGLLERSRKRVAASEGFGEGGGDGAKIGERFQKKRKMIGKRS